MVQAARDLPQEIQAIIEVREWDMRTLDAVRLFKESRVKKLPSIAINGELIFESLIPDQEEFIDAIVYAYKHGNLKLTMRYMQTEKTITKSRKE